MDREVGCAVDEQTSPDRKNRYERKCLPLEAWILGVWADSDTVDHKSDDDRYCCCCYVVKNDDADGDLHSFSLRYHYSCWRFSYAGSSFAAESAVFRCSLTERTYWISSVEGSRPDVEAALLPSENWWENVGSHGRLGQIEHLRSMPIYFL